MASHMLLILFVTFASNMATTFVLLLLVCSKWIGESNTKMLMYHVMMIGYPEGHIDNPDKEDDLRHLKEKVDAGADLIVTQLFFDADVFINFVERCRAIGITCPILPGIFPIQNYNGLKRVISFSNNEVPQKIWDDLEPIKDDDAAVKEYGINLTVEFVQKFRKAGVNGFHIYTFNLERSSRLILERLNLVPPLENVKPLPWNPVSTHKMHIGEYCLITHMHYSHCHPSVPRRMCVLFSGRIVPRVTFVVLRLGTNSLMVVGVTLVRLVSVQAIHIQPS